MPDQPALVLIADDDDDTRYVFSRLLSHRGFAVAQAADGVAALALARTLLPALVIMDYLLPGMTGWEATSALRADPRTAKMPVINVTAYSYPGIADDARAAGCDAFIEKPCDPFEVINLVVALVAGDRATPAEAPRDANEGEAVA